MFITNQNCLSLALFLLYRSLVCANLAFMYSVAVVKFCLLLNITFPICCKVTYCYIKKLGYDLYKDRNLINDI